MSPLFIVFLNLAGCACTVHLMTRSRNPVWLSLMGFALFLQLASIAVQVRTLIAYCK